MSPSGSARRHVCAVLRKPSAARLRATNASLSRIIRLSGALAFRRSTAAFVAGRTLSARSRPRFTRSGGRGRYPKPLTALKPSTWLAGLNAGGDDARTARERSVWLRPREPPSLHFREYPRPKGPSRIRRARRDLCIIIGDLKSME
jgi:hypothetical protein